MRSILSGMDYVHNMNIVHRDLKPDNILVGDRTDMSSIKIADFGLSAKCSFAALDDNCGTPIFMAPEIAFDNEYAKSVDLYSIGIIMYMLLTGGSHPLYSPGDDPETYKRKLKGYTEFSFPKHLSSLAENLFKRLTKKSPYKRYTTVEALSHPWITRHKQDTIPLTIGEQFNNVHIETSFRQTILTAYFLSTVKVRNQPQKEDNKWVEYKRLLNRVSNKIDRWR